ncbi:uncharacterized protein LOC143900975 [Temnothorax americanus]|uniref:uncharacterized protein LOC143900975 n=1 Tax=Temnothorax americanus TaxID=1964332 RepID=UPI004068A769
MGKLRGWLAKYCILEENSDSVKCNVSVSCEEVFSHPDRRQKLKDHLCDKHNITELDTHPKRGILLKNYIVSKYEGTCNNHCNNKTINFKKGVHLLIKHLKRFHSDKCKSMNTRQKVRKRADVWNKFDVKGKVATCKTCNTTLKHRSDIHILKLHLLRACKNVIKKSKIWNKFDVKGNVATCKTCNTIIKHCSNSHMLKRHLLRACENVIRRSKIWNKFDVKGNVATCKTCNTTIKNHSDTHILKQHLLRGCENVIRRSKTWNKFDVKGRDATRKTCKKVIKHHNDVTRLRKHLLRACKHAPTSSSSMRDSSFPLNKPQSESTIRTSIPLLGQEGEEIERSDDSNVKQTEIPKSEIYVPLTSPGTDYWHARNSVADQVFITDVTVNLKTVTIKECKTEKGFFRERDP